MRYLRIPKHCFVTLKTTLAKGGHRVVPCCLCPQTPVVGVLLQPGLVAISRLTNNLQPSMSTTINRLISSDLEKDILMFARPTVACPEPWAGASAAGGAGDAQSQEYPVPCSVSPCKNGFVYACSCSLTQLQGPYRCCTASHSPVPSNPPDEFRNGCGHPHIWCMFPSHSSTSNSKHRQAKKAPAQVLLPGRHEEGKTGRVVGRGGDVSFWISHSKFGL